jgi:hypothetical protein
MISDDAWRDLGGVGDRLVSFWVSASAFKSSEPRISAFFPVFGSPSIESDGIERRHSSEEIPTVGPRRTEVGISFSVPDISNNVGQARSGPKGQSARVEERTLLCNQVRQPGSIGS